MYVSNLPNPRYDVELLQYCFYDFCLFSHIYWFYAMTSQYIYSPS